MWRSGWRRATGDDLPLLRDLRGGLLDVVFMSLPLRDPEIEEEPLWQYEMVLVVPPAGPPKGRARINLEDLRKEPFILYRRPVVIDEALRNLRAAIGFEPNVVMENDEPDSIKELIKLGLGISILPLVSKTSICLRSCGLQSPLRWSWLLACANALDFRPVSIVARFHRRLVGPATARRDRLTPRRRPGTAGATRRKASPAERQSAPALGGQGEDARASHSSGSRHNRHA